MKEKNASPYSISTALENIIFLPNLKANHWRLPILDVLEKTVTVMDPFRKEQINAKSFPSEKRRVINEFKKFTRCLTCTDRGEKDVAHASWSGSCPIFRAELRRLRGGKLNSYSSTSGEGRKPRTF